MPTSPLPDELRDFLAKPNPSVIATLRPDGQPVTVATWYVLDGDRILVNMVGVLAAALATLASPTDGARSTDRLPRRLARRLRRVD